MVGQRFRDDLYRTVFFKFRVISEINGSRAAGAELFKETILAKKNVLRKVVPPFGRLTSMRLSYNRIRPFTTGFLRILISFFGDDFAKKTAQTRLRRLCIVPLIFGTLIYSRYTDFCALRAPESTLRSGRCWTSATGTQHPAYIRIPLIFFENGSLLMYVRFPKAQNLMQASILCFSGTSIAQMKMYLSINSMHRIPMTIVTLSRLPVTREMTT